MNYIIKRVLKKILTQYLFIKDDELGLESGIVKLPAGNINHSRIDQKLKSLNIRITASSYKNLVVHLPIMEILSKPIKISIQTLDVTIEKIYDDEERKESQSEMQQHTRKEETRDPNELKMPQIQQQEDARESNGYFRNLINRLLYNMQIFMERINIKMIDSRAEEQFRQAFFTLSGMSLKNSLIILEANIIKKTLNLQLLHVRHSFGEIQVKDLNICFDFNNKKINLIAILGSLQIDFYQIPIAKLTKRISKKLSKNKPIPLKKQSKYQDSNDLDLSVFFKISSTKISSKLISLELTTLQSSIKQNRIYEEAKINFHQIFLKNCQGEHPDQNIIQISYLPILNEVKIYSEFEDNIIKNVLLYASRETSNEGTVVNAKVYHLMMTFNANQFKLLLDSLLLYEKEITKISKTIKRMIHQLGKTSRNKENIERSPIGSQQSLEKIEVEMPQSENNQDNILFNAIVYRFLVKVIYDDLSIKTFGTATFNSFSPEEKPSSSLASSQIHKKKLFRLRKFQENEESAIQKSSKLNFKLKILQLGLNIADYNTCEVSELQCLYDFQQLIVSGCNLTFELSLKLADKMKEKALLCKRDAAYYAQKLKKLLLIEEGQIILSEQSKQSEEDLKLQSDEKQLPKIYLKFNQVVVRLGELSHRTVRQPSESKKDKPKYRQCTNFIAIVEAQLVSILVSLVSNKLKVRSDIITYLYSPYTLQRNPLTNELQCCISHNLKTKQFSLSLNNNLIILIEDQYINIIYKLFDKDSIWCRFRNLTHQKVIFLQQTSNYQPILTISEQQYPQQNQSQTYFHSILIEPFKTNELFWLHDKDFKLILNKTKTQYLPINQSDNIEFNPSTSMYESHQQLVFENGRQSGYIIKLVYNQLGNLQEIALDYQTHIVAYSKTYHIHIQEHNYTIPVDREYAENNKLMKNWQGHWYYLLEEIVEDYHQVSIMHENIAYRIEHLMANEQFTLFGLCPQEKEGSSAHRIYASYLLQSTASNSTTFTIMPFLIIRNQLDFDVELQIVDKKSDKKESFAIEKGASKELNCNDYFDYYMKQFIIKVVLKTNKGDYESDSFYFNTFIMVDQTSETAIQLRSTQKQNYTKKTVLFSQELLLKTKLIILKNSARVLNQSDFSFSFRVKSQFKDNEFIDQLLVDKKQMKEWCCRLKNDTKLEVLIINQVENKIDLTYGEIKNQKVLSFNFCKIEDRYYNLLVKIESRNVDGIETIEIQNFVEIINLCQYVGDIHVQQRRLGYDQKSYLPLNSTSLNKYNNKVVDIDDMNKIYAEIFLTAKVTDNPVQVSMDSNSITFSDLVKHTSRELQVGSNRFVFTLLKDMNYNRITFYLTDGLYNQKIGYTIFSNQSQQYFLLSDDSEYSHHFIIEKQISSSPPQKIFINKQSFNCLLNKENHDILLCDKDEKHLQKIDKKVLEKQSVRLQQLQFDLITLYDCCDQNHNKNIRRQISTKNIEVRVKMFNKIELNLGVKALTLRLLENGKVDCLIQDISIKNQETKDHLLRIPEQTYLLLEGKILHNNHFFLIKNVFVKCKNIIVNIKRQMPYSLINLISNLGERMGLNIPQQAEVLQPRKYRQIIKKFNGEIKLKKYLNQMLLLVKNVFVHEIHLSLTIELENLSFSNVIILPQYQISNRFAREKGLKNEIVTFYLTNLLAKFPKLSFLMSNFKSPLNTIKLFFNIRDAMKEKLNPQHIIAFHHQELPDNPFLFSLQRWNCLTNYLSKTVDVAFKMNERFVAFIHQNKKYLILTNHHILWLEQECQQYELTELQNIRIIKNRINSQIIMRFKDGEKLMLIEDHKKCLKFLNSIQQLLL